MDEFYNPPAANITDMATGTKDLDAQGLASLRERTGDTPLTVPGQDGRQSQKKFIYDEYLMVLFKI